MATIQKRDPPDDHIWTCPGCGRTVNALEDDYVVTPGLEVVCRACGERVNAERREQVAGLERGG